MQEMQEDEIELIDIIRVLWKRRKLITCLTLFVILGAVGTSLILPRVYEVSTFIEPDSYPIVDANGQIVKEMAVVSSETLKASILSGAYDGPIQKKLNIAAKDYPTVRVSTSKNASSVKVAVESSDPEKAKAILDEIVIQADIDIQGTLENEKNKIENFIKLAQITDKAIAEKITLLKSQYTDITAKIQEMEKERQTLMTIRPMDAMAVFLYSSEIKNHQIDLYSLQEKLMDLGTESLTSGTRMENLRGALGLNKGLRVIQPPTVPDKPSKPKEALIVALAGVLGLMGSVMIAFLLEYFQRSGGIRSLKKS